MVLQDLLAVPLRQAVLREGVVAPQVPQAPVLLRALVVPLVQGLPRLLARVVRARLLHLAQELLLGQLLVRAPVAVLAGVELRSR